MLSSRSLNGAVFNNEINDTLRKPLRFDGKDADIYRDERKPAPTHNQLKSSLFESFILHDEINFKVEGENTPLCFMINEIGLRGVEELIDDNALSFTLWTPLILPVNHPFSGVFPVTGGRFKDGPNGDPEKSLELGLNNLSSTLKRRERRTLIRKLRDSYISVPDDIEQDSIDIITSALKSGKLKNLGLDLKGRDVNQLDNNEKQLVALCTSDLLGYKYVINKHATPSMTSDIRFLLEDSLTKSETFSRERIFSSIIELEAFPDIRKSFELMGQPMDELLKVRKSRNAKKFRQWLRTLNNVTDPLEVQRTYMESNQNSKGFFDTFWGKSTKSIAMMFIGSYAGQFIEPTVGPYIGAAGAKYAAPVTDYIFDMADEYLLSELVKGWTPQFFINDLKKLTFKYSV
jgi:hypothetical protein